MYCLLLIKSDRHELQTVYQHANTSERTSEGALRRLAISQVAVCQDVCMPSWLFAYEAAVIFSGRSGFNRYSARESCGGTPARLCKTRYNTTAPMYGVSLTSGQPVTIVQKFPDLLQQVVFEVCE